MAALTCVTGCAVGVSVLNNEEAAGMLASLVETSEVCFPELSSTVVRKVDPDSTVTDGVSG